MLGISDKSLEGRAWEPQLLCGGLRCSELGWCSLLVLGMLSFLFHMETGFYFIFFYILIYFVIMDGGVRGWGGAQERMCLCVYAAACGGQKTTCRGLFSSSII